MFFFFLHKSINGKRSCFQRYLNGEKPDFKESEEDDPSCMGKRRVDPEIGRSLAFTGAYSRRAGLQRGSGARGRVCKDLEGGRRPCTTTGRQPFRDGDSGKIQKSFKLGNALLIREFGEEIVGMQSETAATSQEIIRLGATIRAGVEAVMMGRNRHILVV